MAKRDELLTLEAELDKMLVQKAHNKLSDYKPYAKQKEFHDLGHNKRERLLFAGNQQGKSYCGAAEVAMHLTGEYPDWWEGRRFHKPVKGWAGGITGIATRDNPQRLLLGEPFPQEIGTGAIPKEAIIEYSTARGVADAVDTLLVRHKSGGISTLNFKSYEQGRAKWQGATIDFIWFDEEPPLDIYTEGIARITATNGMVFMTFTPLLGWSDVVDRFLNEETGTNEDRDTVTMTIVDAKHISEEQRQRIIDGYPAHEREARINGVPMLGSGRIFEVAEEVITCDPIEIPEHWGLIAGLDIGLDHPTAIVWLAHDRDSDVIYVIDVYREKNLPIPMHAAALNARRFQCPVSWPHDAHSRDKGSGEALAGQYRSHGVNMLHTHAQHPEGGSSVEAGIQEMIERMQSGRFKVFRHCYRWFEEFRMYHRKDGIIVKEKDDLLDATRYAIMMKRFARTFSELSGRGRKRKNAVADNVDYNCFGAN